MTSSHSKDAAEPSNNVGFPGRRLGIRHVQLVVMATASFLAFIFRYNLSVAIVAMVDIRNDSNARDSDVPVYDWDEKVQGYVLSSFFWGYFLVQIPASFLTEWIGGHRLMCAATLAASLLTAVFPSCVYMGGWLLASLNRLLQGLCQGFVYSSIFALLGVWAPPNERSSFTSISIGASLLGTVVTSPVSGFLCLAYGWPTVFYTLGGIGFVLGLIMIFLGSNSPAEHRIISNAEKQHIQSSLGGAKEKAQVPWKHVLTCVPYYAVVVAFVSRQFAITTYQTYTPIYLGTVLKFDIVDNGIISGLPSLVSWLLTFLCSFICDLAIRRGYLRITTTRKLFNSIACFGSALFIVLLAHAEHRDMAVAFLILATAIQCGYFVGIEATFPDLTPNFCSSVFCAANFISVFLCVWGPYLVGFIVTEKGSSSQWRIVFYLFASLLAVGNVVYLILGTSETQWWNWPDKYKSKQEYEEEKKNKSEQNGRS